MKVQLVDLQPRRAWFSYLAAVGGCLDHLGIEVSTPWLYGGTGLAFMLNMSANVDVGSPIAWDGWCVNSCHPDGPGMFVGLEPNLGYKTRTVCACPYGARRDLESARQQAWDLVRESIDQGLPCVGYELAYPEFFIIAGYTDDGYLFLMPGSDDEPAATSGPVAWQQIAPLVGWIHVLAVQPGSVAADEVVVREALQAVTACMLRASADGMFVPGLAGYDLWADALSRGEAQGLGHRYCAAAYAEARTRAADFLQEAKERLPGRADGLFDDAAGHYRAAAGKLQAVHELHPFTGENEDNLQSDAAAELVREAGAAERPGFELLARIAGGLGAA
jgi:hypothetical protein